MEEIEVNGKKYVLKEGIDEEIKNKVEEGIKDEKKTKIIVKDCSLKNKADTIGIGTIELKGTWNATMISLDYLNQVCKCLKTLDMNETITIITAGDKEDLPIIIGELNEKETMASGFVIAPRSKK